jgi:hypothetical protein
MINNRANLAWAGIVAIYALTHIFLLPNTWGEHSISDSGIFSFLTITLLTISLLFLLKSISLPLELKYRHYLFALAYALIIYILREADFHRLFTDEHITKAKFYTDPNISLQQKIFGGIPMALFFVCILYLIATQTKLVLTNIFARTSWAIALFLWGLTFITSQLIDKSDLNDVYFGRVIEEMIEFCASGYVLLAVIQSLPYIHNLSRPKDS